MEEQKQEVISELYALRAGLSVISQEQDRAKQAYVKIANRVAPKPEDSLAEYYSMYTEKKDDDELPQIPDINSISAKIENLSKEHSSNEKAIQEAGTKLKSFAALLIFSIIAFIFGIALCARLGVVGFQEVPFKVGYLVGTLILVCVGVIAWSIWVSFGFEFDFSEFEEVVVPFVLGLLSFIGSAICLFFLYREILWGFIGGVLALVALAGIFLFGQEVPIFRYRQSIKKGNGIYIKKQIETQKGQMKALKASRGDLEAIKGIGENCKELVAALQNEYSVLLDPRDWEHLDLVIFSLETRRADSVKEALRFVDEEIRTDRIIGAIQQASAEICRTIRAGFAALQYSMERCFASLGQQLQAVAQSNLQIAQATNRLASAASLNAALTAKANVSSQQLIQDVHQMSVIAENADRRLRNST